jgi:tetratricopeptide (TPR) repeat protein
MEAVAPLGLGQGEDFLPVFLQETGEYACWIDARKQDLLSYCWDEGPIEILFVDAAKSWELTNAILRNFGPFLEAGRSRVVLQDFRYHETHWLPLIFDSRPDLWQETEDVDDGSTITFVPLKSLTGSAGVQTDYSEDGFPLDSAERLLRDRIAMEEPGKRHWFLPALYRKYLLAGPAEQARNLQKHAVTHGLSDAEMAMMRPWGKVSLPAEIEQIPSMLSMDEKQYLIWLTTEKFEGWGAIVELGVWMGTSSAALAEGLRRRHSAAKIHSLDLFRWENYMTAMVGPICQEGEDFLPLYLKATAAYAPWIEPQKMDLMETSWDGGPIEILFVDSAKSWELTNAILNKFGAHLVPGRSRVVLQDFRFHYAHCLPLIFDSRPDVWKQTEDVKYSTTVTFMPLKPLCGPSGIHTEYSEESFPLESAENLLRARMAREEPQNRYRISQALYRKYLIDGPIDEALNLRQEVLAGGVSQNDLKSMESVNHVLCGRGWKAFERGDYKTARQLAERCLLIEGAGSVYPSTLLGFSLLRLGEYEGVKRMISAILSVSPDFTPGRLLRIELAIAEARYEEAAAEALEVLKAGPSDETTIHWCLTQLFQAWSSQGLLGTHSKLLTELEASFNHSPSFLTHLAIEQFNAGRKQEALVNLDRALNLVPDYELAAAYRDQFCGS